jgi:flagellar motor switch protein FliN
MTRSFTREIAPALVDEIAIVVAALIDAKADVMPGAPLGGGQWLAEIQFDGNATGTCTVAFDAPSAAAVTSLIMGIDGEVPSEAVIDTFRELCNQAIGSLSLKPVARGALLKLGTLAPAPDLMPGNDWAVYAVNATKLVTPVMVTVWGDLKLAPGVPTTLPKAPKTVSTTPKPAAEPPPPPKPAPPAPPAKGNATQSSDERFDVILDIDLPLTVRFGRTEMPLKSLSRMGPGSLIDLGRSPDDPVEILVSNRVVARGEVVIVSGNYGIRILDVVSPRDRARSLEE